MEKLDDSTVSEDVLCTLGLLTKDKKYNNAAALLTDKNDFYGIDIVRFGDSINEIMDRETEAVANALLHRDWSVNDHIRIVTYPDRIEIKFPGSFAERSYGRRI